MQKGLLLLSLALTSALSADLEMGCSISDLLQAPKSSLLQKTEESNCTEEINEETSITIVKTSITEKLMFVKVLHESKELLIERTKVNDTNICPPFCIEPMKIKDVITVAELEVLTFIDKLKEKKARLLIDVRESGFYSKGTIPGAINLPYFMLKEGSEYQEEVLKLLGAKLNKKSSKSKKTKGKWSFQDAQFLLIFGSSKTSSEASSCVKELLKLGYPSAKLLYYRAGITSWKALGLTTY